MSCPNYTFRQNDFYCTKKNDYVPSDTYYRYCRGYSYDECPVYKYQESSGCFITTVVHNILGNPDNCQVLNDFRRFRDTILQKNAHYKEGLKEYDGIGPIIACKIAHDKDAKDMADMTYQLDLLKVHKYYLQGEYDKAYLYYCKMTRDLISYYELDQLYEQQKNANYGFDNFNQSKAGHGKPNSHKLIKVKA